MKRPKPISLNHKFASEEEERQFTIDCLAWFYAERMSLDLDIPQEACADRIKEMILTGKLQIELDGPEKSFNRFRLVPVPTAFKPC